LVIKYGGNAMASEGARDPILAEAVALYRSGAAVVLVHGGGPEIDLALAERGIVSRRIDGMRVTDAVTLHVTESLLCGTINKRIVRACTALGAPAVGISGQDGAMLVAQRALTNGGDLGYVGAITTTDVHLIQTLLSGGFLPVVAPLAVAAGGSHSYNVNADLAAGAIAAALQAHAFVAVTNVARVLRDPDIPSSGIERFTPEEALLFAASDACRSNMKPKLLAASDAVIAGAEAAYICASKPNAIACALAGDATVIAPRLPAHAPAP
jgi:acetylglutamate kinase